MKDAGDWFWQAGKIAGVLAVMLGLAVSIRNNWPKGWAAITWPFRRFARLLGKVLTLPRWLWRQLWTTVDDDGLAHVRGPWTRCKAGVEVWFERLIHRTTAPEFEASRAASLAQHEGQNERFTTLDGRLATIDERLDRGAEFMGELADRVGQLEQKVQPPRPPGTLSRATDSPATPGRATDPTIRLLEELTDEEAEEGGTAAAGS